MRDAFLRGARAVQAALDDPAVAAAWDEPSVLAGQSVGSLAGHLARGGVWVVGDYLGLDAPPVVTIPDAVAYFVGAVGGLDDAGHQAIRDRGAAVAGAGVVAVRADLAERTAALEARLASEPADRVVAVVGGAMRLDDYLLTRVVEQVVHLDDLARSLGRGRAEAPDDLALLVAGVGVGIAAARHGATAAVRLLFRNAPAGVVPVLA